MSVDTLKKVFNAKVSELINASSDRSLFLNDERYDGILREVTEAQILRKNNQPLTSKQYRRLRRYDITKYDDTEKLIEAGTGDKDDPNIRYYCKVEELFDVLETVHINVGHKRTRVMEAELKKKYCNITRQVIDLFLTFCEQCQLKRKVPKRGLVVQPLLSDYMNLRCQVDLVDMQSEPDGDYQFIMYYQDHLTKFTILRPLKTKTAEEVSYQVMDIFCLFGAPFILQSNMGREFANEIINKLAEMWPGMKLVHGNMRHSQSQDSIERTNQHVRDMLVAWMADNNTNKWSVGLRFIQSKKNRALHSFIKTSPYEAMFRTGQKMGLADSSFTPNLYSSLETEEELEQLITAGLNDDRDEDDKEESNQQSKKHEGGDEIKTISQKIGNKDDRKRNCVICEKETSGDRKCLKCHQFVHIICGESSENSEGFGQIITCKLCRIKTEQECAKFDQAQKSQNIISFSNSRTPKATIGTNVVVNVPEVDTGRLAPRNVLAVVVDLNSTGLYQLATKDGILERLYARNEFTTTDHDSVDTLDVPSSSLYPPSLSMLSTGSKFSVSCYCKRYCIDKKCKCRSKNLKCNSKCHKNSSCKNK